MVITLIAIIAVFSVIGLVLTCIYLYELTKE